MADPGTAHDRAKRLQALMAARARAESEGQVSAEELQAAAARNAAFRQLAEQLAAVEVPPGTPKRVPRGFDAQ